MPPHLERLQTNVDENVIKDGLRQLDSLALAEYHQSIVEVLSDPDTNRVTARVGRLIGVLIKEPFADSVDLPSPSSRTSAYRAWQLKDERSFYAAENINPDKYKLFDHIRTEVAPPMTLYALAQDAQYESGFFGLYAKMIRKYICGDKLIRKKVEDAFKAHSRMGGSLKAPTPEGIVGAGGLALGVYLVQAVPALGMAGAPIVAGLVLILYVLGVDAFCKWSDGLRTDETEKH